MELAQLSDADLMALKNKQYDKLSNDALSAISKKKEKAWYDVSKEGLAKSAVEALPVAGGIAGGVVGSALGPFGTLGGAGLGTAAGKNLENIIKAYGMGESIPSEKHLKDVLLAVPEGVAGEAGGQITTKALQKGGEALMKFGYSPIASKLKDTDLAARLKNIMYEEKMVGGPAQLQEQVEALKSKLGDQRRALYQTAAEQGATVTPEQAAAPALSWLKSKEQVYGGPLRESPQILSDIQYYTRSPENAAAKAAYAAELKNFRNALKKYNKNLGEQPLLPYTDLQKTSQMSVPVELQPAKRMTEGVIKGVEETPGQTSFALDDFIPYTDPQVTVNKTIPVELPPQQRFTSAEIPSVSEGSGQLEFDSRLLADLQKPTKPVRPDFTGMSLEAASQRKTDLYNALKDAAYQGTTSGPTVEAKKEIARGLKEAVRQSASKVEPGLGSQIENIDYQLAPLLAAEKPLITEVGKSERAKPMGQVSMGALAAKPLVGLTMLATKAASSVPGSTKLGYGMSKIGESPEAQQLWRMLLLNEAQKEK